MINFNRAFSRLLNRFYEKGEKHMGIMIKHGHSVESERELNAYIAAFPVNHIGKENGIDLYFLPCGREDEVNCFQDMELNTFCGCFDVLQYLMK